jgi:hypothetical protein
MIGGVPVLAALDVSFLGVGVDLSATRVTPPAGCRLGPGPLRCIFELQPYDDENAAVKAGGFKPNLTLGADCEKYPTAYYSKSLASATNNDVSTIHPTGRRNCRLVSAPMENLGDGRYRAEVPAAWAPKATGLLTVGFFDGGREFFPVVDSSNSVADDYQTGAPSLRTVAYGKAACPAGSHTVPDPATGATCVCLPSYAPDAAAGNASTAGCHKV